MAEAVNKSDLVKGNPFDEIAKDVNEAVVSLAKFDAELRNIGKSMKDNQTTSKKTIQDINAIDEAEIKSEKLLKQKIQTQQTETKLLIEQERLKQASIRTEKAVNSTRSQTLTAYQKESRLLTELRNKYKDLASQNKSNTAEAKALLAQITPLDNKLKAIDKTVGMSQRNVGNYTSALDGLKAKFGSVMGLASQFGLALGGVAIVKGAIDTIRVYEDAIADLSAITGATGKDLDFFKQKSIELGVNVKGGAASVVEAYKLIASAKPELLENADALNSVTEAAILLSKASGMELPLAATALTDAMNQFGAGADQAGKFVDVLAAGAKFGSAEIPQITEALLKFGAVAKTTNVNIQESTGLIEALAEKGLKGAEAGTALRNVMLKLSAPDALPKEAQERMKALGINFDALKDKSKPFAERLEALKPLLKDNGALIKVFGTENAVAATTLLTSTDRIKELTKSVDENGVALEQQNAKSKTLSEAFNRLKETWNGFILNLSNGAGAASGAASAIDFLARNLGTILKVVGQLIKLWIIYKTVTAALKLRESALEWNNNRKAIKDTGDALKEGADKAKGFGSALKGIGMAVAISLLLEIGAALYEIATGAAQADENLQRLNRTVDAATKSVDKNVQSIKNKQIKYIAELNRELTKGNITQAEFNKLSKEAVDQTAKELKANSDKVKARKNEYLIDLRRLELLKDTMNAEKDGEKRARIQLLLMDETAKIAQKYKVKGDSSWLSFFTGEKDAANFMDVMAQLRANIQGADVRIRAYATTTDDASETSKDLAAEIVALDGSTKKLTNTKSKYIETLDVEIEANKDLNEALKYTQELLDNIDNGTEDVVAEDVLGIEAYEKARQQLEIDLLNSSKTQEEINRELLEFEVENLEKRLNTLKSWGIENLDLEQEIAEKKRQLRGENLEKDLKDEFKILQDFQEAITQMLTDQIDKRIALLKKEEDAAKNQQDYLTDLAANGNVLAQQSIAEQITIQREAQAEQARLERQKANIELISAGLKTFSSELSQGKNAGQALASTIASTSVLVGFLKNMSFFAKGTDNAPEGIAVVDEQGAEIITDKHGKIKEVGTGKGARFTHLNKGDKVLTATKTAQVFADLGNAGQINKVAEKAGNSYDLLMLNNTLKGIQAEIKNKPESNVNWRSFAGGLREIVEDRNIGGNKVRNRFRV